MHVREDIYRLTAKRRDGGGGERAWGGVEKARRDIDSKQRDGQTHTEDM